MGHPDTERLYLIDFGLSKPFLSPCGKHLEKENLERFSGNFLFASLNSCRGNSKSRRDDIESAFYMIIFMINCGSLPWSQLDPYRGDDSDFLSTLQERFKTTLVRKLFKMVPPDLVGCLKKVLCLRYDEEPPYDYLLACLESSF